VVRTLLTPQWQAGESNAKTAGIWYLAQSKA
jgi:hypothetical protein